VVKTSTSARSPLSPTLWPADAFRWWRSLALALAMLAATYIPATIFAAFLILFRLADLHDFTTFTWPAVEAQFASYAVMLVVLAAALPQISCRSLAQLGLRAPQFRDVVWGTGGAITMIVAAAATGALQEWLFHLKADEVQVQILRSVHGSIVIGFVAAACVAAPILEELMFRGFILNGLLRYMPAWLSIVLSGAVFGSVHYQPGNLGALIPLAVGGMVLGFVYYRSGSLVASMMTHALFNTFTVVLVLGLHQV
jgi:membrane protease YdiL (CAAX protease family)